MIRPRPDILDIPLVPHGGTTQLGVLDFSANLNPFGPSPEVVRAVRTARWDVYPDPDALAVRQLLAGRHGVGVDQVLVGNGCSELIDLTCRAFVRPGDRVSIVGPTYEEYSRSSRLCGAVSETTRELRADGSRLVFVCTPNNPTGKVTSAADLAAFARAVPSTLVVVDEAYADCAPGFASVISHRAPNVLVLRSLTKAHGLAGIRVGYAVGPAVVVEAMGRVRVPWSVNAVALAAAAAVLDERHIRRTVAEWIGLRDEMVGHLRSTGLAPRVAATPFFLLPDPPGDPWHARLRRCGIAVRDCTSFGLPHFTRISPRLAAENAKLIDAIRAEVERP